MKRAKYDYLVVGAGLFGAMFAHTATKRGNKCLVVDINPFVGGHCYTEKKHGIEVHKFGAHIFHTERKDVWNFVNSICEFRPFVNSPLANYKGALYNLPFNMNTFNQMFGAVTPSEAREMLSKSIVECDNPSNLEEYVLSQIGSEIYDTFIKSYTEKQWGKKCIELPVETIKRIPVRFTYDNNYFNDKYQGIPECGYTEFIKRLLDGCDILLNFDYFDNKQWCNSIAKEILYTGPIDRYFDYRFGKLEFRSVKFVERYYPEIDNFQGNAVINFTDEQTPYTRVIEHKHFAFNHCNGTIVSYEYPCDSKDECPPSYPIHTKENLEVFSKYREIAKREERVMFGGRLADYKYYNMNDIVEMFV